MFQGQVVIIDLGSQYTHLITRRTRELGYSAEVLTVEEGLARLRGGQLPNCWVLSGGPQSVCRDSTDYVAFFTSSRPVLGICYGMQLMAQHFGGRVAQGAVAEYGRTAIRWVGGPLVKNCPAELRVWMSHCDHVEKLPPHFALAMESHNHLVAAMVNPAARMMGLQFHPEVEHSECGREILGHFYADLAKLKPDWDFQRTVEEARKGLAAIGEQKVLCAFSGGVDSLVAANLAHQTLGDNLYCFFVDHGLLRPQDYQHIEMLQREMLFPIEIIAAKDEFLQKLRGVACPEQKRKLIGHTFIEVFEAKVRQFERERQIHFTHLLQGTIYPDVIESKSPHQSGGKSATIKSHHNVGGLPERMHLQLIEPLRLLFKDEVRRIGESLGLRRDWIGRHPFPGPGLSVRILGELSEGAIAKVQQSDHILHQELVRAGLYDSVAQALTVLIPAKTVGVKGDARVYEDVIALRIVDTSDFMTATWSELPHSFLARVSSRITNEVEGVTRVAYDLTSKPPGTIEWE